MKLSEQSFRKQQLPALQDTEGYDQNKISAYFHTKISEAQLNPPPIQNQQQQQPMHLPQISVSDFEFSQQKMKHIDISSLNILYENSVKKNQEDLDDIKNHLQDFSKSIHSYSKKFRNKDQNTPSTYFPHQQESDLMIRNQSYSKSPDISKISMPFSSSNLHIQNQNNPSSKIFKNIDNQQFQRKPPTNYNQELELHRMKFYDTFLPDKEKILQCPLKLFKYRVQKKNQNDLDRCLNELNQLQDESNFIF